MLKEYKKSFIKYNMLLIGILLIIVFAVTYAYMYIRGMNDMHVMLEQFIGPYENNRYAAEDSEGAKRQKVPEPDGAAQKEPDGYGTEYPPKDGSAEKPQGQASKNKVDRNIVSVFFYDPDSGHISVISENLIIDEDKLQDTARRIAQSDKAFAKLGSEDIYYCRQLAAKDIKISVIQASYIRNSSLRLLLALFVIYVMTMLIIYFISCRLSQLAARPLERALEMERRFIADTSHDLKTPLSVIIANSGIIRSDPDVKVSDILQWADNIDTAAKNMTELIDEMLTLSKLEAGAGTYSPELTDLTDTVQNAVLQMEAPAYDKSISFDADIAEGIFVMGTRSYLQRIVLSLTENAIKYEPERGSISVKLYESHSYAVFKVCNKGTHIKEEDLDRIFDRFYRSDAARTSGGGHGLGLAICRQMTELMGGELRAESPEAEGTVFTMRMPTAKNA